MSDNLTTRPCTGCHKPVYLDCGVLMHDRRVGDIPFCSQKCCDETHVQIWEKIRRLEARGFSVVKT